LEGSALAPTTANEDALEKKVSADPIEDMGEETKLAMKGWTKFVMNLSIDIQTMFRQPLSLLGEI
jgi:hypothetical protein